MDIKGYKTKQKSIIENMISKMQLFLLLRFVSAIWLSQAHRAGIRWILQLPGAGRCRPFQTQRK